MNISRGDSSTGDARRSPASLRVVPASADRFDDVAIMLAPQTASVVACWCLVYRLDPKTNRDLGAGQRREAMLCNQRQGAPHSDATSDVIILEKHPGPVPYAC